MGITFGSKSLVRFTFWTLVLAFKANPAFSAPSTLFVDDTRLSWAGVQISPAVQFEPLSSPDTEFQSNQAFDGGNGDRDLSNGTSAISAFSVVNGPMMVSPAAGSVLNSGAVTFSWDQNGSSVEQWWLYLGSPRRWYRF